MTTTVAELYGEHWAEPDAAGAEGGAQDEFAAVIGESLLPRGPEILYDRFAELGVRPGEFVLDLGGRDAKYAIELALRFGVRVLMIDPVPQHMGRAAARIVEAGVQDRVMVDIAGIERLPVAAGSVDHLWCRDVLNHVDLYRGMAECARVLRPGGGMLVYQTFSTRLMESQEARRLYQALAIRHESMSSGEFETAAKRAGFRIGAVDVIDSEWRELWAEGGDGGLVEDLLWIARIRRSREMLERRYGAAKVAAMEAGRLWGVYQMLGKLCPTVYLLHKQL